MSDLLPCPFCRSADVHFSQPAPDEPSYDFVICNGCGASFQKADCDGNPIDAWNRRAVPAQASAPEVVDTRTVDRETLEHWRNDLSLHGVGDIDTAAEIDAILAAPVPAQGEPTIQQSLIVGQGEPRKFQLGDQVRKTKGSQWKGEVVGQYATELNPEGYCVESSTERGSVQIYPAAALELVSACQPSANNERTD